MSAPRALALLALLARAAPAAAVPDGPLGVGTPGTFRGLFLEMPLSDARPSGGAWKLDVRWWLANDWSVPTRLTKGDRVVWVQQDEQADVLQLAWTAPWSRFGNEVWLERWRTTAEIRLIQHWGGWTDQGIERWHDLIGTWNFQREFFRRNEVSLRLAEEGGRTLADIHHGQPALSDLTLRTQGLLAQGALGADGALPWAVALRADLKLPTGRVALLGGSGGVDAGLGVTSTLAPLPWLTVHGQGALRLVSPLPHGFPLRPEPLQWGLDLSVVARIVDRVALVLEDRLSSRLFRGGWGLAPGEKEPEATAYYSLFRSYNQISGGLRVGEVTVFFAEDFTPGKRLPTDPGPRWFYNSNSPDVMLGVAWARQL
jgi:hypothetical protein